MSERSGRRIRVLVVDDSAVMRRLLAGLLATDPAIEVVGTAADPYAARESLIALRPDVMTLDIAMPRMDGLTFLERVMQALPTRTVVVSSLTAHGSPLVLRALAAGAIDVVTKPHLDERRGMSAAAVDLVARVKAAAGAQLAARPTPDTSVSVIALAASTGGTEALKVVLRGLPPDLPGIVVVQHMPPHFTKSFAEQLGRLTALDAREASDGDRIERGRLLLAPGDYHMTIERAGSHYRVRLSQEPPLHGVRPAADHLFRSVAVAAGARAVGALLTGMGRDGAAGLLAMRQAGAFTVAQNEATSVVFGMPRAAIELGAAVRVAPLAAIAPLIVKSIHS